jgi:hypothetical protein
MPNWFETVTDLDRGAETLRKRRYGVIEMCAGRLVAVRLRPWPKFVSLYDALWLGEGFHRGAEADRCWLYYNQPRSAPSYLTLKYIISGKGCSFATFRRALIVLDQIAQIKRSDAIVCEASNPRISERLLRRWGWERHVPASRRRHYIKRLYGNYPTLPRVPAWSEAEEPLEAASLEVSLCEETACLSAGTR